MFETSQFFPKKKKQKTGRGREIGDILTIGIRQHQCQDEKYCKPPPRQLETALVKGQERHADREDEHDCIPVSRYLGVSAHDLEVGIVILDVTTGETGDSDLPGTAAVVAQLLWWIRLLVVHSITLPAEFFFCLIFCFFKHCEKKDIPQRRLWPRYWSSPRRNGRYTTEPTVITTHGQKREFLFFFHPQEEFLFFARNTYMRSATFRKSSLIQLKLRSQDRTGIVGFSRSSVDAGRHGAKFLRVEGVGVVEDRIEDPAGEDDGDALRDTDPERGYQRFETGWKYSRF